MQILGLDLLRRPQRFEKNTYSTFFELTKQCQNIGRCFPIFVTFSEYLNFNSNVFNHCEPKSILIGYLSHWLILIFLRHASIAQTKPRFVDFVLALMEQQVLALLMSIVRRLIKRLMFVLPIWYLFVKCKFEIQEKLSKPIHFGAH